MNRRALVRPIAASFADAITGQPGGAPIDVSAARRQHAAYVRALEDAGVRVSALPVQDTAPDSCFVEDVLVARGGRALITRPGHPSRRRETASLAAALPAIAPELRPAIMEAPARLDGGDVLVLGRTMLVGRSGRTDEAGIAALRATFEPAGLRVRPVDVDADEALHLKCHCSALPDGRLLAARGRVAPRALDGVAEILWIPEEEAYAANVVALGDRVLVAAGYPRTAELVAAQGWVPVVVDISEIARADGSLTCLSVLY